MIIDLCLYGAVRPPSCVPRRTACACAAVWSWFRSWSWYILRHHILWIRTTVWSSVVPPPPCLDTQSCCMVMELISGLDLFSLSDTDLYLILLLIFYIVDSLSLFCSSWWSTIEPVLILCLSFIVLYIVYLILILLIHCKSASIICWSIYDFLLRYF